MTLRPLSEIIEMVLNGLGEDAETAGTVDANEMAGRSLEGAARQFTAAKPRETAEEERSGVRLVWVNPTAMRKRASDKAHSLMVVK